MGFRLSRRTLAWHWQKPGVYAWNHKGMCKAFNFSSEGKKISAIPWRGRRLLIKPADVGMIQRLPLNTVRWVLRFC